MPCGQAGIEPLYSCGLPVGAMPAVWKLSPPSTLQWIVGVPASEVALSGMTSAETS